MSLENKNPLCEDDPTIKDLADQVYQAFSTIGFVYSGTMEFRKKWLALSYNWSLLACLSRDLQTRVTRVYTCNVAEQFFQLQLYVLLSKGVSLKRTIKAADLIG